MSGPPGISKGTLRSLLVAGCCGLAAAEPVAAQCAMCATAAEAGDVGRGLTISIFFMLGTLLTLVGGVVLLVVRASRPDAAQPDPPAPQA